ncbi:SdiA-regulated domain-containing protein [Gelidibacter salicanalis]|uniref:SdiA-regulated domain-containing protein n=1 Tax=Gelidibacter salicanalis TaxID=291193 RepID=A0A934KXR3_9FLAO|nr:SdiA-regulated domain-containing protein [Gelidibacter salicanalis]MBJ7882843.1 SdiA-regulated domain-containing protein [Gelidibacter salicanalis]
MKKSTIFIGLFIAVLIGIGVIGFAKVNKASAHITEGSDNYTISETWELPKELDEISGIVWIDHQTIACVQDETGMIYIYNLDERAITEEIPFAGNGDYEGIALHNNDLYVMQSDGLLYEVKNWNATNKIVTSHQTGFDSSHNMESLVYSIKDSALLTAPKDKDLEDDFKGLYKIALSSKNVDTNSPAYKIEMNAAALKPYRNKKRYKTFNPSEIAVHPTTHDIYVLEGKNPKLLIMDSNGVLKTVFKLDKINFPQPEGMTFSDQGDLYISNESANGPASIHLVEFNK